MCPWSVFEAAALIVCIEARTNLVLRLIPINSNTSCPELSKYSLVSARQRVRVVKEMDSKSIGLCPQGFEYPRRRSPRFQYCFHLAWLFVVRKLCFGPCRQEERIGANHFAFHGDGISYRDLTTLLHNFTLGQDRIGDLQGARLG